MAVSLWQSQSLLRTAGQESQWQASTPPQHLQVVGYAHASKFLPPRQRMEHAVALEDFYPPLSPHHRKEDRPQSLQQQTS